jgi:hypothetical protein
MWVPPPPSTSEEISKRENRLLSILLGIPPAYLAEVLKKPLRVSKGFEEILWTLFEEKEGALPISLSIRGRGQTLIDARQTIAHKLGVMDSLIAPKQALLYASLGDPGLGEIMRSHIMGQKEELLEGKVSELLDLDARHSYERYLKLLGRYLPVPLLELGAWQTVRERLLSEAHLDSGIREAALQSVSLEDFKRRLSEVSVSKPVKSRLLNRLKSWVFL